MILHYLHYLHLQRGHRYSYPSVEGVGVNSVKGVKMMNKQSRNQKENTLGLNRFSSFLLAAKVME